MVVQRLWYTETLRTETIIKQRLRNVRIYNTEFSCSNQLLFDIICLQVCQRLELGFLNFCNSLNGDGPLIQAGRIVFLSAENNLG